MQTEEAGRKSMSSKIYELSERGICDLCLHIDYVLDLPVLRIHNAYNIIKFIQLGESMYSGFAVGVVGPMMVEVAGIMRLQLRTAGQSCDGSDSRGCRRKKPLRIGPTI